LLGIESFHGCVRIMVFDTVCAIYRRYMLECDESKYLHLLGYRFPVESEEKEEKVTDLVKGSYN
jgi:hypothetical protein